MNLKLKRLLNTKISFPIFLLSFYLFILLLIICLALLRHEFMGGKSFPTIQKHLLFISEIPSNLKPNNLKKNFKKFLNPEIDLISIEKIRHSNNNNNSNYMHKTDAILLLSRFDGDIKRAVVDVIDLIDFRLLHTYIPDIDEINKNVDTSKIQFKNITTDKSAKRFRIMHPYILNNGDIVFHGNSPLVKLNLCNEVIWLNDEFEFHHSINIDKDGNFWIPTSNYPFNIDEKLIGGLEENYHDDSITQIDQNGQILFHKSLTQIMMENNLGSLIFGGDNFSNDPIHLNDIQPVLTDGPFWKKNDLFLSSRHLSAILQYRPETNKIIKIIRGPFYHQHDIDILSDTEIAIFNNNNLNTAHGEKNYQTSEIIIYNLENEKISKLYQQSLEDNNFYTETNGSFEILQNGVLITEETNYGRLLMINKKEEVFEFINRSKNNLVYIINWFRVIENKNDIEKIRKLFSNNINKC